MMEGLGPNAILNAALLALNLAGPPAPLDTALETAPGPPGLSLAEYRRPPGGVAFDNPGWAARIIAAEGGPAENPLSSAAGYGQFLRGTWLGLFRRAYPNVAEMLSPEQILALRHVRPLAEDLVNRFARENAVSLQLSGLPATEATLSLAHAVGAGGAVNVLSSAPDRPLRELLSPQAIAANPQLGGMTAEELRQWAMLRVSPPAAARASEPLPSRPSNAAPKAPRAPNVIGPAEDFRVDGGEPASQILNANRAAIERLRSFVEAPPGSEGAATLSGAAAAWLKSCDVDPSALRRGEPAALRALRQAAQALVFATIRDVASRPNYRQFAQLAQGGKSQEPGLEMLRDLAMVLTGKMERENTLLLGIAEHRRTMTGRPPPRLVLSSDTTAARSPGKRLDAEKSRQ